MIDEIKTKLKVLEGNDYEEMKSKDFENLVCDLLKNIGEIKRQVWVNDRGDGRRGKIDLVIKKENEKVGVEIDRISPRKKSIFKLNQLQNMTGLLLIVRSPFSLLDISK